SKSGAHRYRARLADLHSIGGILKRGYHLATGEKIEVAVGGLGAGVVGKQLAETVETLSRFQAPDDIRGLRKCCERVLVRIIGSESHEDVGGTDFLFSSVVQLPQSGFRHLLVEDIRRREASPVFPKLPDDIGIVHQVAVIGVLEFQFIVREKIQESL